MKKTIAILGDTGKFSSGLTKVLMKQDLRLLFISEDEAKKIELKEQLGILNDTAEVEFTSCEREGCWEADIIVLIGKENISPALVQKIKEVATQKTVLVVSEEMISPEQSDLEKLLPNSNVIKIQLDNPAKEYSVIGKNADAVMNIRSIFENAGYQIKI